MVEGVVTSPREERELTTPPYGFSSCSNGDSAFYCGAGGPATLARNAGE
jgi:hypothetical protein